MSAPTQQLLGFQEHLQRFRTALGQPCASLPLNTGIASLMTHGGLQVFASDDVVMSRIKRMLPNEDVLTEPEFARAVQQTAQSFFYRLSDSMYVVPSDLMSFLTFPHEGRTYTREDDPKNDNPNIPAVFTFVGQFVDHDLTMNALDLFVDQTGPIADGASPIIDLDSLYGPRSAANGSYSDIFTSERKFKLRRIGPNAYDLPRADDQKAFIFDPRNDENQLILQIHLLLMRVHNKIIQQIYDATPSLDPDTALVQAYKEVVSNWQSVLLNDYLTRILTADTLQFLVEEVQKPGYGKFKHRPRADGTVRMPHEFALGFRMGHSQLRSMYHINQAGGIQLFNNRDLQQKGDLRGSKFLPPDHVIDWDVFLPKTGTPPPSLKIDGKVTHAVFDLPESAIPDNIKYIGNLPHRNLIRSRQIQLTAGEDLADFYGIAKVDAKQIEEDKNAQYLFEADGGVFKTPLWYYILKEAEIQGRGARLGALGSRLMGEVILGGIFFSQEFKFDFGWQSVITNKNKVLLRDLVDFVQE